MAENPVPNPREQTLKATAFSPMNFMREELEYDLEQESLVRFRGAFIMPSWDDVEDNEVEHVVEGPDERLDKIAAQYWGSARQELWWVIAARNEIDLPAVQLYKGRKLKIPTKEWVDNEFMPQSRTLPGLKK